MLLDLNFKYQLEIPSRHGPVKDGMIVLIKKIKHLDLQRKVQSFQRKEASG